MARRNLQLEPIRELAHLATNLGKEMGDGSRTILRKNLPRETRIALEKFIEKHAFLKLKNLRRIALLKSTRTVSRGRTMYHVRLIFNGRSIYLAQIDGFFEYIEKEHIRTLYSFEYLEEMLQSHL